MKSPVLLRFRSNDHETESTLRQQTLYHYLFIFSAILTRPEGNMNRDLYYFITMLIVFTTMTGFAQPAQRWTVAMCIDTALAKNIDLLRSDNTIRVNEIALKQARENLLPTLNASASQNFNSGRSVDPYTYQYVNTNISSNSFGLNGGLLLFNGLQQRNAIRQTRLAVEASEHTAEEIKNTIVLSVLNSFLQVLFAREQVELAREQVKTSERQREQTISLMRAGKRTETDLLKLQAQLGSDSLKLIQAQNIVRMSRVNLIQTMNIPVSDDIDFEQISIDQALSEYTNQSTEDIFKQSLEIRPEVKSAALRKEGAMVGLQVYKGAYLPRLSLSAGVSTGYSSARKLTTYTSSNETITVGYLQNDPSQLVVSDQSMTRPVSGDYPFFDQLYDNINRFAGLNLSIPILNYRQARNNVLRQKIAIKNAELEEEAVRIQLRKAIEQAYTDMLNSKAQYEASLRQLDYAERSYKNVQDKYGIGVSSSVDLQLELNSYMQARGNLLQAKYQYVFNLKTLDLYQGRSIAL